MLLNSALIPFSTSLAKKLGKWLKNTWGLKMKKYILQNRKTEKNIPEAIICLGDTFLSSKTIESMKLRTETAVELYKKKRVKIIFTGGFKTRGEMSEAKFMADYAISLGLSNEDIILEERSNTTAGNAYYCKKIMEKRDIESAIVITSPHHLKRARYIFKKIIPNKNIEFKKCKNNLKFFERIQYNFGETKSLIRLMISGIDSSKL